MRLNFQNMQKSALKSAHVLPGLICGTGRYASATTTTAFDGWTSGTVTYLFSSKAYYTDGSAKNYSPFSLLYKDGSNNQHGLQFLHYGHTIFALQGEGQSTTGNAGATYNAAHATATGGDTYRKASFNTYVGYTFDTSTTSNNLKLYIYNDFYPATSSTDNPKTATGSLNFASANDWGDVGTNTEIRIGNMYNGTTATYQCAEEHSIHRVQMWKNTVFSQADIESTMMWDSTNNCMAKRLIDYSAGGYTQPHYEWIPVIGNNSTIPDTGSATAVNLTIQGSAEVGYVKEN